jgi:hypothetical protein
MHFIATGKVQDREFDIPGGIGVWGSTVQTVASAAEDHYSVPPPTHITNRPVIIVERRD